MARADQSFDILLTRDRQLFSSLDPDYLDLIHHKNTNNTYSLTKTFRDGIHWVIVRNMDQEIIQDQFYVIQDNFKEPLEYLISNEYNITDHETRHWLDKFQNMFIGYQPDPYENISQDSLS